MKIVRIALTVVYFAALAVIFIGKLVVKLPTGIIFLFAAVALIALAANAAVTHTIRRR